MLGLPNLPESELIQALTPNFFWLQESVDPVVLANFLSTKYTLDWVTWEYETLRTSLEAKYKVKIPPIVWEKIMALRGLIRVDSFWEVWNVFEKTTLAFNGILPNFGHMQFVSPGQMAYAVNCANSIRKHDFSDEVKGYVAARLADEGIILVPKDLVFCEQELDRLNFTSQNIKEQAMKYDFTKGINADEAHCVQKLFWMSVEKYVEFKTKDRKEDLAKIELESQDG